MVQAQLNYKPDEKGSPSKCLEVHLQRQTYIPACDTGYLGVVRALLSLIYLLCQYTIAMSHPRALIGSPADCVE